LEALSRRVGECVAWDEEAADIVRIAVGGIRERLVRAVLVCWRDGTFPSFPLLGVSCRLSVCLSGFMVLLWTGVIVDADHFYVLEDWVIDKSRGNGITGWVAGTHSYQRQVIQSLEQLVKYPPSPSHTFPRPCPLTSPPVPPFQHATMLPGLCFIDLTDADYSFGANLEPGRRVVGKIRGGVIGECKKEFETTIFATLETAIKLAKGTVVSPVSEDIEQVLLPVTLPPFSQYPHSVFS